MGMDMFKHLIIMSTTFALSTTYAHADAVANCNSHNPALILTGCTALIEQGKISGEDVAVALNRRAEAYLVQGATDKAIADFRKAMERDKSDGRYKKRLSEVLTLRGDNEFRNKHYDEAILDYTAALQLTSSNDLLYARRAEAYFEKDLVSNAIADMQEAMILTTHKHPQNKKLLQLYQLQATQFERIGDLAGAIRLLDELIALDKDNIDWLLEGASKNAPNSP